MSNWKSNRNPQFRNEFSENMFYQKYAHDGASSWDELSKTLVEDVCSGYITKDEKDELANIISDMKFIPGGRYLYYAGRTKKFFNNCYLLRAEEDTREDWADLSRRAQLCLMTGGGIGADYSIYRGSGKTLSSTGGIASGPLPQMYTINEIGRHVMQGGSRRSAIYASLSCRHEDINQFIYAKDWHNQPAGNTGTTLYDLKQQDFNFPAPLDMTNISVNYDTKWLLDYWTSGKVGETFVKNTRQALLGGEPGFSFNFFEKETESLRNA